MNRIVVFLFCMLAAASASRIIVPLGKEVVYDYMAEVMTGTQEPVQFGSRFYMKCKLHIQGLKEDTYGFKMTDCMFRINNGKMIAKDLKEALFLPFPAEATELMMPFHVQYDSTGKVMSFIADSKDKEWSMNIKRAITNIFQFDMEIFKSKTDEFMIFPEETLYGRCDIRYALGIFGSGKFELYKALNPTECSHKDGNISNFFPKKAMYDQKMLMLKKTYEPYTIGNNRNYKIMFVDGFYRIDKITANGDVVFAPYKARSDVEQFKSIQTFEFINMISIPEKFVVNDHIMFKGLEYISPMKKCQESAMNVVDFTGGRHMMKYDLLMTKVYTILDEVIAYLDMNQISNENMKMKHSLVLNRLLRKMKLFDVQTFEQVFTHLHEKKATPVDERKYKIFLQMLPSVGTRMSVVFIRNLIRKQKIDEDMAIFMLQNFPMHVECPNEKLLMEVEDFLTVVTDVKSRLYRACILSFSSLFGRTFTDMSVKSELVDKYIMMMLTKFKESSDYHMKMLYIRAMGNMRHTSVLKYLAPFMFGEEKISKDLRLQIYWSMYPLFKKDYALRLKYTVPLFADRNTDTELRIVGYTIFMMGNIDNNHFLNTYWYMATETNEVFYTFHYNTMVAMSKCEYKERADMARLILRISRKPIQLTYGHGIYFHMLNNEYFGYGGWTEQLMYNTHDTMGFYGSLTTFVHQKAFNLFGFHMRIRGVEGQMRNEMIKELMDWKTFFAPNDFFKKFETMNEHFSIEFLFFYRQRCIMTYFFDKTNIHDIMKVFFDMKFFENDVTQNMQQIYYPLMVEKVIPIDCGLPFMFFEYVPMMKSWKINFHKDMKDDFMNMHMNMRFKMMVNGNRGMKFYNPIIDAWHGIAKAQSFAFVLPLNFDFVFNYKTFDNFRLIFNKVPTDDVFGFQNYFKSSVFIQDLENKDLLTKFNDKAQTYETITRGDTYKKSMSILDKEDHFFGRKVQIGFFNCERPMTVGAFVNKMKFWFEDRLKHMDRLFFTDFWIILLNFHTYVLTYPEIGTCGYNFRWMPSMDKPVERIEFVFHFHKEQLSDPMIFLKEENWDMKLTMMHKGAAEKIIRNYDMHMMMHLGKHHMDNKFHFTLLRTEAGLPEFKFDFDFKQVFTSEGLDGILKLIYGNVDNLGIVDIHGKAMWSEEQKMMLTDKSFTYTQCMKEISIFHTYYPRDFHCMLRASMFHHYTIDIKFNDRNNYYIREILGMREKFFYKMMPYMQKIIKKDITDKNMMHIDIAFPVLRREVDITVDTPQTIRKYLGVPMDYYLHQYHNFLYYYNTRNIFYSYYFMHLLRHGLVQHCVVDYNTILTDSNSLVKYTAPKDWILYAGDVMENPKFGIWIKKVDGTHPLALKIKIDEDILEIIPHGEHWTMMLNGKEMSFTNGFHMESFFNYFYVPNPEMVMLMTHKYGLHIEFDGHSIRMHYPYGTMMPTVGKCMTPK